MKKKALALLLVLAMMLSIVLVSAPNVQAAPESPHTEGTEHCICGKPQGQCQSSKGGSHTYEAVEWLPWDDPNDLPTSGNYYLTTPVNITSTSRKTVEAGSTLNLCLNGQTVSAGNVQIYAVKGTLSICDCGTTGKIMAASYGTKKTGGLFQVYDDATLNIYGGEFTQDHSGGKKAVKYGGIIYTGSQGSVANIYGGYLHAGRATQDSGRGGNIYVSRGTVNMYGGVVADGVANGNNGKNVYVQGADGEVAEFNLLGGTVINGDINTNTYGELHLSSGYIQLGRTFSLSDYWTINLTGDLVINTSGSSIKNKDDANAKTITSENKAYKLYLANTSSTLEAPGSNTVAATVIGDGVTVAQGERLPAIAGDLAGQRYVVAADGKIHRIYIGFDELTLNKTTKDETVGYGMRYNAGFKVAEDLNVTGYGVEIKLGENGTVKSQSKTGALPADGVVTIALTNILVNGQDNTAAYTTDIWARTFVQLGEGEAIYSVWYKISFQEVVEAVSDESLADANAAMRAIEDLLS